MPKSASGCNTQKRTMSGCSTLSTNNSNATDAVLYILHLTNADRHVQIILILTAALEKIWHVGKRVLTPAL